jgi:hypothetical protein
MTPGIFRLPSCRVANKPLLHDFLKWPRKGQLSTFQGLGSGVLLRGMCLCGKLASVAGLRCLVSWHNIAVSRHICLGNLTSRLPLEGNAPMHLHMLTRQMGASYQDQLMGPCAMVLIERYAHRTTKFTSVRPCCS